MAPRPPSADAELTPGLPTVAVVHQSSGGHVRPLLPLVAALGDRGARTVQWAFPEWEAECRKAGDEFRSVPDFGIDMDPPPPNLIGVAELIARATEQVTPWVTEQIRDSGADVVLRDTFAQYGRYAAYEAGLPQVAFSPATAIPRGIRPALWGVPAAIVQLAAGMPDALRPRRGAAARLSPDAGAGLQRRPRGRARRGAAPAPPDPGTDRRPGGSDPRRAPAPGRGWARRR